MALNGSARLAVAFFGGGRVFYHLGSFSANFERFLAVELLSDLLIEAENVNAVEVCFEIGAYSDPDILAAFATQIAFIAIPTFLGFIKFAVKNHSVQLFHRRSV